jgi:hypothetical protein
VFATFSRFKRLLATTTALVMAAPMLPAQAQEDSGATPPSRVGEVASVTGSVSFNGAGSNGQWVAASENYPLTSGDSLFTQTGGQASIMVDSSRLTLSGNTELQVTGLDSSSFSATASQGETFLAVNYLLPNQNFVITTPRGTVTISENGNYDIQAGDANDPTVVTVLNGAATVSDPGATVQVQAGQETVLSGGDQTVAQLGPAAHDDFIDAMLAEQAPAPPSYVPAVAQQMTGVSELSNYGSWSQDPTYGAVWYPQVASDWAPYRVGHWAYVAPWGYTWVDAAPWGFAPFHYGRWIDVGDRWGWVPAYGGGYGADYQPVYAPALVSFFGLGVAALTIGALATGSIGWVPLAPDEPFYPYYHYSPAYLRNVNYVNVRNINVVNIHNTTVNNYYGHFANRGAATYIPADAMSRGGDVAHYARPVPTAQLASARPFDVDGGGRAAPLPAPHYAPRPAAAPHLAAFNERRDLPPAVISHEPAPQLRPGQAYAGPHPSDAMAPGVQTPRPPVAHPGFATVPGYRAPPPPPGSAGHSDLMHETPEMNRPPAVQGAHPDLQRPNEQRPEQAPQRAPEFDHNAVTPAYHPKPTVPQFHPEQEARPRPEMPAYRPSAPEQQLHMPTQQFHPQEIRPPEPNPQERQRDDKRPGQP